VNTPIQFLLIAVGIILALKSVINGGAVASLPVGWMVAEESEEYSVYIWLGAVLVFGICLILKLRTIDARNNQNRPI